MLAASSQARESEQAAAKAAQAAQAEAEARRLREELLTLEELLDGEALARFAESGRPFLAERVLARLQDARGDRDREAPVVDALALAVHASSDGAATPLHWVATVVAVLEGLGAESPYEITANAEGAEGAPEDVVARLRGLAHDAYVAAARACCASLERVVVPTLLEGASAAAKTSDTAAPGAKHGQQQPQQQHKTAQIVAVLAEALRTCKAARLPQALRRAFLAQLVHAVDALVVDALLARQEFCTCATGFALRMGLSSLEAWLQRDPDTVPARRRLARAREAANFFVMDKALFADDAAVAAAFRALNVAQLARLLEYFHPDELSRTTVDAALVRDMNAKAHAAPECSLLIDPLSLV